MGRTLANENIRKKAVRDRQAADEKRVRMASGPTVQRRNRTAGTRSLDALIAHINRNVIIFRKYLTKTIIHIIYVLWNRKNAPNPVGRHSAPHQ